MGWLALVPDGSTIITLRVLAERASRLSNTHTRIVALSRTPPPPGSAAHTDRVIQIGCESGRPGGAGLPQLTIRYSLSPAEQVLLWREEERKHQSEAEERLRAQGLRPEEL